MFKTFKIMMVVLFCSFTLGYAQEVPKVGEYYKTTDNVLCSITSYNLHKAFEMFDTNDLEAVKSMLMQEKIFFFKKDVVLKIVDSFKHKGVVYYKVRPKGRTTYLYIYGYNLKQIKGD